MKKLITIFVFIILISTLIGVLIGRLGSIKKNEIKVKADIYYTTKNDSLDMSIVGIENIKDAKPYLRWINKKTEYMNFDFTPVGEGQKLYLIEKVSDKLFKMAIFNNQPDAVSKPYMEIYIWTGFLKKSSGLHQ